MERRKEDKNYIYGIRSIIEAIESGEEIDKILIRNNLNGELYKELSDLIKKRDIPVQRVPEEKLNRITRKNHQGTIAFISPVRYYKLEDLVTTLYEEGSIPFFIVLDGITDTGNFGAIARTATCAGVDAIVIPEKGSVSVTPASIKTSAGALFHIPVCRCKSVREAIKLLKENGIKIVGASEKASELYTKTDFTVPVAIVMGAEDTGISQDALKMCDELVSIPMMGDVASLNVSVAAGVMMYEAVMQRLRMGMEMQ